MLSWYVIQDISTRVKRTSQYQWRYYITWANKSHSGWVICPNQIKIKSNPTLHHVCLWNGYTPSQSFGLYLLTTLFWCWMPPFPLIQKYMYFWFCVCSSHQAVSAPGIFFECSTKLVTLEQVGEDWAFAPCHSALSIITAMGQIQQWYR